MKGRPISHKGGLSFCERRFVCTALREARGGCQAGLALGGPAGGHRTLIGDLRSDVRYRVNTGSRISEPLRRLLTDIVAKVFLGRGLKFSEPLVLPALRDVRDHIVSRQNDHGPSYRRHAASQRQRCVEIDFGEIFGVVGFSTFATKSALFGPDGPI